jgi:hypothetical protein
VAGWQPRVSEAASWTHRGVKRAAASPAKKLRRNAGSRIGPLQITRLARSRGGQPQPAPLAYIILVCGLCPFQSRRWCTIVWTCTCLLGSCTTCRWGAHLDSELGPRMHDPDWNHPRPAWFYGVSVSASVSLFHTQLTSNKLTHWMLRCMCYFYM